MLAQASDLLQRLEAIDAQGRITPLGREMAALPLHPRLAHMLVAARGRGAVTLAAELAALLSERDLLRRAGVERDPDIRTRLEILRRDAGAQSADRGALQRVQRNAEQFRKLASSPGAAKPDGGAMLPASPGALLATAFPDRIAQRRREGSGRYLLANGRGAAFGSATGLGAQEFLVAIELDDREREARIDLAVPLARAELEFLFRAQIRSEEQVEWDARSAAVRAHRTRHFDALLLDDRPLEQVPAEIAAAAMLEGVRQLGLPALPWDRETRNLQARMEFVRRLERGTPPGWPASDDATLLDELSRLPALAGRHDTRRTSGASGAGRGVARPAGRCAAPGPRGTGAPGAGGAIWFPDSCRLRGRQRALHRGAPAGGVWPGRDAAYRRRCRARHLQAPVARAAPGADHT
jgi:ATP-dependent helicase HrpB